ncbi:MAG: hypothetical protein WDN27_00685 [Candidatus Saccharibacteria bacterium]
MLAILFWLALQAQVFMYAAEINTVRVLRLYPRSITGKPITAPTGKPIACTPRRKPYRPKPEEEIDVTFKNGG